MLPPLNHRMASLTDTPQRRSIVALVIIGSDKIRVFDRRFGFVKAKMKTETVTMRGEPLNSLINISFRLWLYGGLKRPVDWHKRRRQIIQRMVARLR